MGHQLEKVKNYFVITSYWRLKGQNIFLQKAQEKPTNHQTTETIMCEM
jgi:hypothetical protein